jgi:hypothetical protein
MTDPKSQRQFLTTSGLALADLGWAALGSGVASPFVHGKNPPDAGSSEISVWRTTGDQRFASAPPLRWQSAAPTTQAAVIYLDPTRKVQPILGFGGAFTDATCYMSTNFRPRPANKVLQELFHPSELGLSVCRTCIGSQR